MASVSVKVGDITSTVDLDDETGLLGFTAAVQYLALMQQGIESSPDELLERLTAGTDVAIEFDDRTSDPDGDEAELVATLAGLVDAGVLTEAEFEAKVAALTA